MKPRLGPSILPAGRCAHRGATLLELLIALGIAGIIALGLYAFFGATYQTYTDQTATARMIQNATTAMTMITKDIRMAGTFSSTTNPAVTQPCRLLQALVSADNASGGTITIRIVLDDAPRRTELAPPGQSQGSEVLRVLSTTGFAVNDTAFITDGVECTRFTVTEVIIGGNPGLRHVVGVDTNSPGGGGYLYPAASSLVYRRATNRTIIYAIEASGPAARWLTRDTGDGQGPVRVVPDIESLRFSYEMNVGPLVTDPITIDTAAEAANIRLVSVALTSRAERPSRVVGGDGFRRHILTSSVQLRNLGQ